MYHIPVLKNEILANLPKKEALKIIDCTLGDAGHCLEFLSQGHLVLGIDYNVNSLNRSKQRIDDLNLAKNFVGVQGNFKDLYSIAQQNNFLNADVILLDLGYSSSQLNDELGITFLKDQVLDMRIDSSLGVKALDLINFYSEKELEKIFRFYGEEQKSKTIAKRIVEARSLKKFETTKQLADFLRVQIPVGNSKKYAHPATKIFQALRIVVNDELANLKEVLPQTIKVLKPQGRVFIISFHSLEDRIVKNFGIANKSLLLELVKKPIQPLGSEVAANSKSRSAKMRIYEKL